MRSRKTYFFVFLFTGAALIACDAIVGVQDVTLKSSDIETADATTNPGTDAPLSADTSILIVDSRAPAVPTLTVCGGNQHTCAKSIAGDVKCWGDDFYGESGNGVNDPDGGSAPNVSVPSDVVVLGSGVVGIGCGFAYSCAIKSDHTVACWGYNGDGEFGDTTVPQSSTPVSVVGVTGALQVSAGSGTTCAALIDGTAKCWGANDSGQCGNGAKSASTTPVVVSNLIDAVEVAASVSHSCAIRSNGGVVCWGQNEFGELGNGGTDESLAPAAVAGVSGAVHLALGVQFSCALLASGQIQCWGRNDLGQLGITTADQNTHANATTVTGITDATGIGAGIDHMCASRKTGAVMCWGQNDQGQLGDGTHDIDASTPNATPIAVPGVTTATGVGQIYGVHSCATLSSGEISCWGSDDFDELGLGPDASLQNVYSATNVVDYP